MNKPLLISITFSCDANGDHTAPIASCVDNQTKDFNIDQREEALKFIDECSYIFNTNEVLEILAHKQKNKKDEKVINNTTDEF